MMTLYSNLPHIDLHGETREISIILVNEFISDQYKLRNKKIIIIHGIGKNILKKAVHESLKINKLVKSYKLDNFNPGQTIIELDL